MQRDNSVVATLIMCAVLSGNARAYLMPDDYAVSVGGRACGSSGDWHFGVAIDGGDGGSVDVRTGVRVDTGPGYNPAGPDKKPVDVHDSRVLGEPHGVSEYFFRQVAPGPSGAFPVLTVRGDVTIHCQFAFRATVAGDFSGGVPSVTILAGHAMEVHDDPSEYPSLPAGHKEAYPVRHSLSIYMTPPDATEPGQTCDGGRVTFHTTQHGKIDIGFLYAYGGGGANGGRGGNGGHLVFMANQSDIVYWAEGPVPASGGQGGMGGDGGDGGTIALRAESISGSFYALGGDGGYGRNGTGGQPGVDGGDGGDGGVIDVAVTDGSDLVALVYGGAGGRGGDPGGDDGERGSPGQVHTGDYASNPTAVPELVNMDSWTIMLYSAADDATSVKGMLRRKSIEDGLEQELDGMELIRLSDTPVNMLVLMDRHPDKPLPEIRWPIWQSRYDYNLPGSVNWAQWHNTRWGWVSYDDSLSIEEEPEGRFSSVLVRPDPGAECELNTGNPRTLSDFVNWATTAAQAEHRMLVVGSHGSGRRGMAHDDTDKDRLFLPELAEALDDMTSPIDILVIEACICSTVEVLAELAHGPEPNTPRVGYVVAAQSTTNGYGRSSVFLEADGFEIKGTRTWLEDLASGVDLAPKALATRIGNEWTMVREVHAAFDLSMYFDCEKAIREFVDAVLDPNVSTEDIRQLGKIRDFHSFSYSHRDLFMFMLKLDNALSNQPQAIKIMDAAREVRSAFVPMRMAYTSGMGDPPNAGLSVWFPSWAGEDMSEYQHLEFAKATRWHLFLRKIGDTFLGVYDQFNPYFFPDDIPDSEADAQPLDTLGGTSSSVQTVQAAGVAAPRGTRALVESYLHSSSDLDWYRFQADAGQLLHMDIVGLSGGLLSEGMATVFSPQGGALTTVEADHDGGIANAIVRLPASGTYYIQVASSIMSIPGQPLVGQGLYSLNLCLYDPDAYEPNLVVDASELDFSAVEGGETQVGTITLTNLGGASIEIAGIGLEEESSPFLAPYSPLATPFALGPGEAIEIDVGMQSYQGGVAEDTLVVVPTDANYAVVEIPLRVSSYDPNDLFVVGGGVYTDLTDPPTSGLAGVWMTLDGGIVPYTTQTGSGAGLWQIEGVPTGAYTLTPSRPGYTFEHVSGGIPDGQASITVEVNEANEPVNRDVQFLAHSRPGQLHDWNGDGIVSIVGDVPLFVNCVYFQDCPDGVDNIAIGDCNGDGILSIVGDVPCFVECVYFGNCSE